MENISNKILTTFKNRWNELSFEKQRHFAYRASIISDDVFWRDEFLYSIVRTKTEALFLEELSHKDKVDFSLKRPTKIDKDKVNDAGKRTVWADYPQLTYWDELFTHWRYLFLAEGYKPKLSIDDQSEVVRLVFNEVMVRLYPVWAIERAYDLRWMLGFDQTSRLKNSFEENFSSSLSTQALKVNYFYGLTHFVIGESNYYRNNVSEENWAVKKLFEAFPSNVNTLSIDLAVEMAVCLKMARLSDLVDYNQVIMRVNDEFNDKVGVILRMGGDILDVVEHRNIMALLSISKWRNK